MFLEIITILYAAMKTLKYKLDLTQECPYDNVSLVTCLTERLLKFGEIILFFFSNYFCGTV